VLWGFGLLLMLITGAGTYIHTYMLHL
jgi:hypothetical protein